MRQPASVWKALERSLRRGPDSLEEGHYAERSWAGLMAAPLTDAQMLTLHRTKWDVTRREICAGAGPMYGQAIHKCAFGCLPTPPPPPPPHAQRQRAAPASVWAALERSLRRGPDSVVQAQQAHPDTKALSRGGSSSSLPPGWKAQHHLGEALYVPPPPLMAVGASRQPDLQSAWRVHHVRVISDRHVTAPHGR